MEFRNVGRSGLITSLVGMGCNSFGVKLDKNETSAVVNAALDAGYTMFDTSDSYGGGSSEEFLGAALDGQRDDVIIATKFFSPMGDGPYRRGASRRYVIQACEASLRRLGTDYIDLYYQHRYDPLTPVEETIEALDTLVQQGKVRYAACSNHLGWQVADAAHVASTRRKSPFVANQIEWSLLAREAETEVVPACRHFGIGIIPYFPLSAGILTGKYRRGEPFPPGSRLATSPYFANMATEGRLAAVEALHAFAEDHGRSLVELALSWLASQAGVACILAGATTVEQVTANASAADWHLSDDVLAAVNTTLLDGRS